jgi:uncharacterized membrane protein
LEGLTLLILWFLQRELALEIVAVITASIISGRTASILAGQELGLYPLSIILILSIWNSGVLFVFLPLIVAFSQDVLKGRFLGNMLDSTRKRAETQKSRISKYGPWGLPLFVWLPFPWTGALVGAVIGFLMGMSVKKALLIVVPSMIVGVVSWVFGFQYLFILTGVIGKIICVVLLVCMLLFPFLRILGVAGKA